jgi:uncharacterized protein (TIGR03435 family)
MLTMNCAAACLLCLVAWAVAEGQTDAARPTFEVVDIKVDTSGAITPNERFLPGGRIELTSATVKEMIEAIYGVKPGMIIGGPPWISSTRYNMVAKATPGTNVPVLLEMVKTMLADQFHLAFHNESKVMPAYALTLAKDGPQLKQAAGGRQACSNRAAQINGAPAVHRECKNIAMPEFARMLGLGEFRQDDRPVVDRTELSGIYDVAFEYGRPQQPDSTGTADLTGPTVFEALEKIGLKLEPSKQSVAVMVIDRAERPPDN